MDYLTPVGKVCMASDGERLSGLWLENQKYDRETLRDKVTQKRDIPLFQDIRQWLGRYFDGEQPPVSEIPLAPEGSDFRHIVWDILYDIPYGKTVTYGEVTKAVEVKIGRNMSAQAVGGAIAHNPILIIIPCHRVIGANGSLTGYAGGIDTKVKLLEHEGVDMSGMNGSIK